jgi:hypothetical protein
MEQDILSNKEIMEKLAGLQLEVETLKKREDILEKKLPRLTVVEESLAEIWDNEEDEIWNEY